MKKIAAWSGPRNISTALMRSFENRKDTFVTDEPFYAHYLYKTNKKHPMYKQIVQCGDIDWNSITNFLTGNIPFNKNIWYQKHMIHHIFFDLEINWIYDMINIILIRHPRDVILSYSKKFTIENIDQLGFKQQVKLYNMLKLKPSNTPIVIETNELLINPKKVLKLLCNKLQIKFYNSMLLWPSGTRKTDGIWGKYWYKNVENSFQFNSPSNNKFEIPYNYKNIYMQCMTYYQDLYQHRIT